MMIVNNTGQDLSWCMKEISQSLKTSHKLPEELDDLISVEFVKVGNEERAILDMVDD